jgi:hypothetical protein
MLARITLTGIFVAAFAEAAFAQADKDQSGIGYPTVAAALEAVKAKPGVRVSVRDGWTVMDDRATMTVWSFTPTGHPAHPTAVRREVKQAKDGSVSVQQSVLCQAQKPACDKINAEFVELNNKMRRAIERDRPRSDGR